MTRQQGDASNKGGNENDPPAPWLRASLEDAQGVDFEAPIAGAATADCRELGDRFGAALRSEEEGGEPADNAATRVYRMLAAVAGMHFRPEQRNEPFGPMVVFADGRRSSVPEDFRGAPLDVLAYMAERAVHPILRARLSDVSWLLDRKRGTLGILAISSYVEIVRKTDAGELKFRFGEEGVALHYAVRDYLRRALQIGRTVGWDKPETVGARDLAVELRKRANDRRMPIAVHWFSNLDLDLGLSDAAEVATGIEGVLKSLPADIDSHIVIDLWRLAARAYHAAKRDDDAHRCQSEAAECLASEADAAVSHSAMLASHSLSAAIAELHGVPGKKDRRTELCHRLIDIQARIPDEMSIFSQEMDLTEIVEQVEKEIGTLGLLDKLLVFADIARSPDPSDLVNDAMKAIRKYPLASLFGASHHDREGKVIHRTEGGGLTGGDTDPAVRQQIAQTESIRRKLIAFGKIEVARRTINKQHYLSDEVFAALLQYSPFVPQDLLATFTRGFVRFFRGDFVSATYILTPLLENSLRHVLKAYGHNVTIFDDATQTQQDRPISSIFEQMRSEMEAIFTRPLVADIENVFLQRPGPHLRHSVAHGLLNDGDPYGADALYGCWLIIRLCLAPLFRYREQLNVPFDFS